MGNARNLADNLPVTGATGNRNIIINGAMEIAQRGTSHTSNGFGSLDRMRFVLSGATGTMSQEYMTVNDKSTTGFAHYMRMNITAGADAAGLLYTVEGRDIDRLQGKKLTLSFWARGTNPGGGNFSFDHNIIDVSDFSLRDDGVSSNLTVTSTWTQYSFTFDFPTASNVIMGNNEFAAYDIYIRQPTTDNTSNAWQLDMTGLMLEEGEKATPYEHEPYHITLARCQRYFYKWNSGGMSDNLYLSTPYASGTPPNTSASVAYTFPVTMRKRPSMTALTGSAVSNLNRFTSSVHNAVAQQASTGSNAALSLDSWTADAEI